MLFTQRQETILKIFVLCLGLSCLTALNVHAAGKPAVPAKKAVKLPGMRAFAAVGQQEYVCQFSGLEVCKEIEVQIWLIPNMGNLTSTVPAAGCVAAFPYRSLAIPFDLGGLDHFDLKWKLPAPLTANISYRFVLSGGIEVKALDEILLGKVAEFGSGTRISDTRFTWRVTNVKKFVGNHQPNVEYMDANILSGQPGYGWNPCNPVDPVITNTAN